MRAADDDLFGSGEGAGIDILDLAAEIADEMVMMAAEGIGQFVARESFVKL